jgi:hypothetical protein
MVARKQGKPQKVKKEKEFKSVEERTAIVDETIEKLREVHLVGENDEGEVYSGFDGVEELLKILREYKKPNILSGFTGVIKLPELGRNVEYILPLGKNNGHGIRLVSDEKKDYVV